MVSENGSPTRTLSSAESGQDDTVARNKKKARPFREVDSAARVPKKKGNHFRDSSSDSAAEPPDHDKTRGDASPPPPSSLLLPPREGEIERKKPTRGGIAGRSRPPRRREPRSEVSPVRTGEEKGSKKRDRSSASTAEEEAASENSSPTRTLSSAESGQDDIVARNKKKARPFRKADSAARVPKKKGNHFRDSSSDSAAELPHHDKTGDDVSPPSSPSSSPPRPREGETERKEPAHGGIASRRRPPQGHKPRSEVSPVRAGQKKPVAPKKINVKRRRTYPPPMVGSPTSEHLSPVPRIDATLFVDPAPVKSTALPKRRRSVPARQKPRWKRFYFRTHSGTLIEKWHDSWHNKKGGGGMSAFPLPPSRSLPPPPSDTLTLTDRPMTEERVKDTIKDSLSVHDNHDDEAIVLTDALKQTSKPVVSRGRFYMINQSVEFWKNKPLVNPDEIKLNQGSSLMAKVLMNKQAKIRRQHMQQLYRKSKAKAQKESQVMDAQTLKMVPERIKTVVKPSERGPYTHGGVGITAAYNSQTKKITFTFKSDKIWFHVFNPELRFMLGWGKEQPVEMERIKELGKTRVLEHVCQLNYFIEDVYLYCDFVQWSAIGSIESPFLSYHNLGKLWSSESDVASNSFEIGVPSPKYIQVEPKVLTHLGFKLADSSGTALGFLSGRVVITLHFIKK